MNIQPMHSFHIPVMGLAFTVDSPIKVARYGISSVISILEDNMIEKMREYYYKVIGEEYIPITNLTNDFRAKRVTDYLNLVNRIVSRQFETLKNAPFVDGSEIVKYFNLLPDNSQLKIEYQFMKSLPEGSEKKAIQQNLRNLIKPGSIDVNIMTKIDFNNLDAVNSTIENSSVALSALRGYANSDLKNSGIVFSAGMNPRLYNYVEQFNSLTNPNEIGFDKRVIIKVSDYRSALIQGKYLARKGIWVSEFRIESSLNCGGHVFATEGHLMGPILEEFKIKRNSLKEILADEYIQARNKKGFEVSNSILNQKITVQGGIGTHMEDSFIREFYHADGTGWGTPFLLVPEATTVDAKTLELFSKATIKDLSPGKFSPLGVRFNYLKGTSAETERLERAAKGKPGSPCTERYLATNTEFSENPICTASSIYQAKKIAELQSQNLNPDEFLRLSKKVYDKECLCINLSNTAFVKYDLNPINGNSLAVTACPSPNIAYFSKVSTLEEMVDHIYGRKELPIAKDRPHFFIQELKLYLNYLEEQVADFFYNIDEKTRQFLKTFCTNLLDGIAYYKNLIKDNQVLKYISSFIFDEELNDAENMIQSVLNKLALSPVV